MSCSTIYEFWNHRGHLVRQHQGQWKDVTKTNEPFTHQQLKTHFHKWEKAVSTSDEFKIVMTFDYAYEDDLKDAIKLMENFNAIKDGDKHKANGHRYNKDVIIDAINKGQSQSYISEKYGLSRSQYYKIKASV